MAKASQMPKKQPKVRRRLKKQVRKTLGALFLASALAVAAIPLDSLQAADITDGDRISYSAEEISDVIPLISQSEVIYSTGDSLYQFAYVNDEGPNNKVAVILGYAGGALTNNSLVIPDTFDTAYAKYTATMGTTGGYAAVGQSGNFLFYRVDTVTVVQEEVLDELGVVIVPEQTVTTSKFNPCYYSSLSDWDDIPSDELYYSTHPNTDGTAVSTGDASEFSQTSTAMYQRVRNIRVSYIGNQYLVEDEGPDPTDPSRTIKLGTYHVADDSVNTDPNRGVFANYGNIVNLKIGEVMQGIGNYAFYGCTGLGRGGYPIELGNGLNAIGNSAFEGCINMSNLSLQLDTNLKKIGANAFKDCQTLRNFILPTSVTEIGDSAFENCYALRNIDLCSSDGSYRVILKDIGVSAFKNCTSLERLNFQNDYSQSEDISLVQGCTSLKYIRTPSPDMVFTTKYASGGLSQYLDWEEFKATVPQEFYFEGPEISQIHTFTKDTTQHIDSAGLPIPFAFRYLDQNKYEIVMVDESTGKTAAYQVDSSNTLIAAQIESGIEKVELPTTIGPYKITSIDGNSFVGNCFIKEITIPSSILTIASGAFEGCHDLESVIFAEPVNLISIGTNAFKTQNVKLHNQSCSQQMNYPPVLTFTGPIGFDSVPFQYAMNPASNINNTNQDLTYITYYSGWPSNLEVKYNPTTDKNTLVDYPTVASVISGQYTNYPYIGAGESAALLDMAANYGNVGSGLTEGGKRLWDAIIEVTIPEGIEAFQDDLFKTKENNETIQLDKTITTNGLDEIPANSFEGCKNLSSVNILGDTTTIGDYAFQDCVNLQSATITATVSSLGLRPFAGCEKLTSVNFSGGPYYTYANGIIYKLDNSGVKDTIVECLESRGNGIGNSTVGPDELIGVKSIAKEAFMDCINLGSIQLDKSSVTSIPEKAFYNINGGNSNNGGLYNVILPATCKSIDSEAFRGSAVNEVTIPGSIAVINNDAFDVNNNTNSPFPTFPITFITPADSVAAIYAGQTGYENITISEKADIVYFKVAFWSDPDGVGTEAPVMIGLEQTVENGKDAIPPADEDVPQREGFTFSGWLPDYHAVSKNMDVSAQYDAKDPDADKLTVRFIDWDDKVLKSVLVAPGGDAEAPNLPSRDGYMFTGWRPGLDNIQEDTDIYAQYEKDDALRVNFYDHDGTTLINTQKVSFGENVTLPKEPLREGYNFTGWLPSVTGPISASIDTYAQYEKIDSSATKYTVRFIDYDDNVLYTQLVNAGETAIEPRSPSREGYVFTGWRPAVSGAINKDTDTYAQYGVDSNGDGKDDNGGSDSGSGSGTGTDPGTGSGSGSGNGDGGNGNGSGGNTAVYYTLTVQNGSGSGSYVAGASVIVIANDPAKGQDFDRWTIDPDTTKIASKLVTATVITMPESEVTVTAHYISDGTSSANTSSSNTGSGSSNTNNSGSSSGNSGGGSSGTITNDNNSGSGGTTVIISKNGLSNTGVVTAVVNGSSDDFVIRLSENNAATEDVLRALINEFGSLDNIVYFPMDISLYDSTGNTEITDTTGLSIDITLPIPDSMITYAGNNKVASVVNQRLEKLNARFSTISGVSCVTFRATHFSPYVIYVDTSNLTAGTISDNTPKTGDGMHPKWFLALGLACMSVVFFMKKDRMPRRRLA
jgi:hypothetical protein